MKTEKFNKIKNWISGTLLDKVFVQRLSRNKADKLFYAYMAEQDVRGAITVYLQAYYDGAMDLFKRNHTLDGYVLKGYGPDTLYEHYAHIPIEAIQLWKATKKGVKLESGYFYHNTIVRFE